MIRRTSPALLALLFAAALDAQAPDQGDHLALGKMWTFENPPLAYLEQEYGFKPDAKWLDGLRLGALRLGERGNPWCSASFVSPKGLVMTNHHCVRDKIAEIQGANEWVANGFAATALADEVPVAGLTVQQLIDQQDITAAVEAGIAADTDAAAAATQRAANIERIVADADAAHPGSMHQVVALYEGAIHQLYRYRVFDDLRLVVAPHLQTAHFGGDPDNFTYPRWSIDFSFVRAYENGAPADTQDFYFRWRERGAVENELVFVPGNPGDTNRQMTVAQLEYQRDVEYPLVLEQLRNGMQVLRPFAERAAGLQTTLLSWENSNKAIGGMLAGLHDDELLGNKRDHEAHFRAAVQADAGLAAQYGTLWDELQDLAAQQRQLQPKVHFYSPSYSGVLERGVAIAKALDETLAEDVREAARQEAVNASVATNALVGGLLLDHFVRAGNWLPADDAFLVAVGGEHRDGAEVDWPAALKALGRSELRRAKTVRDLLAADDAAAQFAASEDPGIVAARALWPLMRDTERAQKELESTIAARASRIGKAMHAVYGTKTSPDATMTLRFSDGLVLGYDYNGTLAPWATTFYGLFARGIEFGGAYPFDIPRPWLDAESKIDLKKKVCFVSTNDIVGGNSGSCVVDKDLRIVGLVFDGNIESLPNDFYYTQQTARAVSVHTDAIVEALAKVYGMGRVVDELRNGAQ